MFPKNDVVRDLDQIIDFAPLTNPSSPEPRPIDRGVRADLDIIVYLHDSGLRYFEVAPVRKFEPKSITPNHHAAVQDDAIAQNAARGDRNPRSDFTIGANPGFMPDVTVGAHYGASSHLGAGLNHHPRLNTRTFGDFSRLTDHR